LCLTDGARHIVAAPFGRPSRAFGVASAGGVDKPEQEQVVGQAIQAGPIANAGDIVDVGIEPIRQRLKLHRNEPATPVLAAWERDLDTRLESFPDAAPDEALRQPFCRGYPARTNSAAWRICRT
jgi:hypothetical protein